MMKAVLLPTLCLLLAGPTGAQATGTAAASTPPPRDAGAMERARRDAGNPLRRIIEAGNIESRNRARIAPGSPQPAAALRATQELASSERADR